MRISVRGAFGSFLSTASCYALYPGVAILYGLTQGTSWYLQQITQFGTIYGVAYWGTTGGPNPPFTLHNFFFTGGTEPPD